MAAGLRDLESVKVQHAHYRERLGVLVSALRAYGYCTDMPDGALYVWVRAKSGDCWTDMEQLAKIGIIASPGEFYGAPECLRFSTTASDEAIASALRSQRESNAHASYGYAQLLMSLMAK